MTYRIEKEDNKFYAYEIDEYKNILALLGVFNTEAEAEAEEIIKENKIKADIYDMNQITNYEG